MTVSFSKDLWSIQPKPPAGFYSKMTISERREWHRVTKERVKAAGVPLPYPTVTADKDGKREARMKQLAANMTAKFGIEFEA